MAVIHFSNHLIKTYGHEGMRNTFFIGLCIQNDQDSVDYILAREL